MSDRMIPLTIDQLYKMVFGELKAKDSIFGIPKAAFFNPNKKKKLQSKRFDQLLESPLGVAAGPHTQLSQNIISAWLVGCRYIELKTVQTLDELEVSKPCIDMEDEGYNCEWSQELKLEQSFHEYLNAWILIHILKKELGYDGDEIGTIFNMSLGYNMEGVLKPNVQKFLRRMRNCTEELAVAKTKLATIYPEIDTLTIPTEISNNVTLSTMHGCPPEEIEKIGKYLISEQGLHTTVKLNPTLNGPEDLRRILNETLGFTKVDVPDLAFEHDLKYQDGILIIKNLKAEAQKANVDFSIKLTNTLETTNNKGNFHISNEMMYMSGRPLHVLGINLANKLQTEFNGELDITFSAGADAFNVGSILRCGIRPITVCSDLLKPGGYQRISQYFETICDTLKDSGCKNVTQLTQKSPEKYLEHYLSKILEDTRYHKSSFPWDTIKTKRKLTQFDCIKAPCNETCPTNQRVPEYITLCSLGKYKEALEVIRESNPFPFTTGMACDHICEDKCTRINYDNTLQIRDIKRFIASKEKKSEPLTPKRKRPEKVAIIGGGPSGLSAAFYLALEGLQVEIFEQKNEVGGMITHALPNFRSQDQFVQKDIERITSLGVSINTGIAIDSKEKYENLKSAYDFIYVATGAPISKKLALPGEEHPAVIDFLKFLEDVKFGRITRLPKDVVVIGGGNSAIDAVRSANRLMPKDAQAKLLYRRTIAEMPASREEIEELLEENIPVHELTAPLAIISDESGIRSLRCQKMELFDHGGGQRPEPIPVEGSEFELEASYIIKAIGQATILDFFEEDILIDYDGNIISKNPQIYFGGDIHRGPASIIKAVADGKHGAYQFLQQIDITLITEKESLIDPDYNELRLRKGKRHYGAPLPKTSKREGFELVTQTMSSSEAQAEAARCLECDKLCDICVTVCPNRANFSYFAEPYSTTISDIKIKDGKCSKGAPYKFSITQKPQVINIGNFCNECGNCATFCPTSGSPYIDKPKVYLTRDAFDAEENNAYFFEGNKILLKNDGELIELSAINNNSLSVATPVADFEIDLVPFECRDGKIKKDGNIKMSTILGIYQIYQAIQNNAFLVEN